MGPGQVSVEQLVLVGLALGLLIPAVYFFYAYSEGNQVASVGSQINSIGNEMVSSVKSTYSLGKNARKTLEVTLPEQVKRVYVGSAGDELIIRYETERGPSEAVFYSTVPMTTTYSDGNVSVPHAGLTRYRFLSEGTQVQISEVQ